MVDYRRAIQLGLDAAARAQKNKEEIREAIEDLRKAVLEETDGRVEVRIHTISDKKRRGTTIADLMEQFNPAPAPTHLAIGATNPKAKDCQVIELARWEEAAEGYPCRIEWEHNSHNTLDRKSLEEAFLSLLQDVSVGEAIRTLRSLPISPPPTKP